ncbi:MAG: hypothetical protein KKG99_09665 [Bacteroidetes bacterium]|nr:hypothetical protein [Bacteroidota bacterium]
MMEVWILFFYEAMLTYYEKIAPSRCIGKPLYTCPTGSVGRNLPKLRDTVVPACAGR